MGEQKPMQDVTFVHLSDTHIGPKGRLQYDTDTAANLRQVASRVRDMALDPACFIISGDLSDHGEPASYQYLRELFDEVLVPFGVPVLLNLGNHDQRVPFRRVFLGEIGASDEAAHPGITARRSRACASLCSTRSCLATLMARWERSSSPGSRLSYGNRPLWVMWSWCIIPLSRAAYRGRTITCSRTATPWRTSCASVLLCSPCCVATRMSVLPQRSPARCT